MAGFLFHCYSRAEYCEGGTLKKRLAGFPMGMDGKEAAELLLKVAKGVTAVHDKGVIHRDLKPGNILLTCDDEPRVSDFGIAIRTEQGARLKGVEGRVGTPGYMPPEQVNGGVVTTAADVHALGATLYACLTGGPPYTEATRDVVPVRDAVIAKGGELDRDLDAICMKCLEPDPSRRYKDAGQLAKELDRYLKNETVRARGSNLELWRKRWRALMDLDPLPRRFLGLATFTLGWGDGFCFAILYAIELVWLMLNPVAIHTPDRSIYAIYDTIVTSKDWWDAAAFGFSAWIMDYNKLIGYSVACFWFGMFSRATADSRPLWLGNKTQLARFAEVVWAHPAWFYLVATSMAIAAAMVLAPGSLGVPGKFSGEFSLLKHSSWSLALRHPFFLTERAYYAVLMVVWCLHFTIGVPDLVAHLHKNPGLRLRYVDQAVSYLIAMVGIVLAINYYVADDEWLGRRLVQILIVLMIAVIWFLVSWVILPESRTGDASAGRGRGFDHFFPRHSVFALLLLCMPLVFAKFVASPHEQRCFEQVRGQTYALAGREGVDERHLGKNRDYYLKWLVEYVRHSGGNLQDAMIRRDHEFPEARRPDHARPEGDDRGDRPHVRGSHQQMVRHADPRQATIRG